MFCSKTREDGNKQAKIMFYYNICFVISLFQCYSEEVSFPPGAIKFFLAFFPCLHHYTQEWYPVIHPLGAVEPEHHTRCVISKISKWTQSSYEQGFWSLCSVWCCSDYREASSENMMYLSLATQSRAKTLKYWNPCTYATQLQIFL